MKERIRLKVCGINNVENLIEVSSLEPNFVGFIFVEDSPRYIDTLNLSWVNSIGSINKVGVFRDANIDELLDERFSLFDYLQLHGNESIDYCKELISQGKKIIKSLDATDRDFLEQIRLYDRVVNILLFDRGSGGSGQAFDWNILRKIRTQKPVLIAGGIGLENVQMLLNIINDCSISEDYVGLDVNSQFERSPGIKDVGKLLELKKMINYAYI